MSCTGDKKGLSSEALFENEKYLKLTATNLSTVAVTTFAIGSVF